MPNRINENQINIDWLPSVASYVDLLKISTSTLKDGDCCEVRDEDIHYTWDSPSQTWKSPLKKIIITITEDTVLTENVTYYATVDTSASDITITLPNAAGFRYTLSLKKISENNKLIINTVEGQTIDFFNDLTIQYNRSSVILMSDNSNWFIT